MMHPAKLTFQALRIVLNQEFDEMRRGMHAAFDIMPEHGRLGILTWKHSECAIAVDFFATTKSSEKTSSLRLGEKASRGQVREKARTQVGFTHDDAQRPSEAEMRQNSRSRSATLHVPANATPCASPTSSASRTSSRVGAKFPTPRRHHR